MEHISKPLARVMAYFDAQRQAEAFRTWRVSHATGSLRDDFDRWATSKRLSSGDYLAIWRQVYAESVARGESTFTRIDGEAA